MRVFELAGARARPAALASLLPWTILGAAVAYLYFPVLVDLATQWRADENYSHGFLIPLISAYLVWERRGHLRNCRVQASAWGYPVLLLGVALLIVGQAARFGYPVRLSFIVVLAGLVLLLSGRDVLRTLAFPLAYLLFMVPLPSPLLLRIAFPLQMLAARVATGSLDLLNIPALREGNIIDLASTRLEVAEACSGIRSLISLLALAVIYAYFTQSTWRSRVLLVLSAIPIAVVTNAARVGLTGVLAHMFGPQAAMSFYHTFSGLLIFALAFAILGGTGCILSRAERRAVPA